MILDIPGSHQVLGVVTAFELREDLFGRLFKDVSQHVEAPPVGHAKDDFTASGFNRPPAQDVQKRNQGFAALQRKTGHSHVLFIEKPFKQGGRGEFFEQFDPFGRREVNRVLHRFQACLKPAALVGVLKVHVFHADAVAIGLFQPPHDLLQRCRGLFDQTRCGKCAVQVGTHPGQRPPDPKAGERWGRRTTDPCRPAGGRCPGSGESAHPPWPGAGPAPGRTSAGPAAPAISNPLKKNCQSSARDEGSDFHLRYWASMKSALSVSDRFIFRCLLWAISVLTSLCCRVPGHRPGGRTMRSPFGPPVAGGPAERACDRLRQQWHNSTIRGFAVLARCASETGIISSRSPCTTSMGIVSDRVAAVRSCRSASSKKSLLSVSCRPRLVNPTCPVCSRVCCCDGVRKCMGRVALTRPATRQTADTVFIRRAVSSAMAAPNECPARPIHVAPFSCISAMAASISRICLDQVECSNRPWLWPFPEKSNRKAMNPASHRRAADPSQNTRVPGTGKTVTGDDCANRWPLGLVQGSGKGFPHMIVELDLLFHFLSDGRDWRLCHINKIHAMTVKVKRSCGVGHCR